MMRFTLRSSRLRVLGLCLFAAVGSGCSESGDDDESCLPDDADGINGGNNTFTLVVDDTSFSPIILQAQNDANVTLTLQNDGTQPHSFVVSCIDTPNDLGCPTSSCFPDAANIPAVAPGESATTTFVTPSPEGIYEFSSDVDGDAQTGQFILK